MRYGWSLEADDWDACRPADTLWHKHTLNALEQDSIPASAGVYAICSRAPKMGDGLLGRLYNVLYVGRAKGAGGLRSRFLAHCHRPSSQLEKAKACFGANLDYWYLEVDEAEVASYESRLIACLGPTVNLMGGAITARIGNPEPA